MSSKQPNPPPMGSDRKNPPPPSPPPPPKKPGHQPTLFPMVKHARCGKCGSVAPLAEFYPYDFTLEDDDDRESNRAIRFDMQCPNCDERLDPQAETFAFAEEVRVGPFMGNASK